MSAAIIDGKAFAAALRDRLAKRVQRLKDAHEVIPGLAVVLVGEDPASEVYVRNKIKATLGAGMLSFEHRLSTGTNAAELIGLISQLNDDDSVDGILIQLPLPGHINASVIVDAVDPDKDVDGFHVINAGRIATGRPAVAPCTPMGCEMLLRAGSPNLAGMHAVIVGRSQIVGRPLANLLLAADCTVTIAHSKTVNLPAVCRAGDILVAAVGKPEMIRGDWIKPGAIVIDIGINRITDASGKMRLVGDVAFNEAMNVAAAITPVPGGVGPMTIACLLENTFAAACRRRGLDPFEI